MLEGGKRMLCQICKVRDASVIYTEIVSNMMTEVHMCHECAKKRGDEDFLITTSVFSAIKSAVSEPMSTAYSSAGDARKCSLCGATLSDITKREMLGCCECYNTFKDKIYPFIEKIQGACEHIGKVPGKSNAQMERRKTLVKFRRDLKRAVSEEQYEEAAKIRDLIAEMEGEDEDSKRNGE